MVIFMIFVPPYSLSRVRGYSQFLLFEASKCHVCHNDDESSNLATSLRASALHISQHQCSIRVGAVVSVAIYVVGISVMSATMTMKGQILRHRCLRQHCVFVSISAASGLAPLSVLPSMSSELASCLPQCR